MRVAGWGVALVLCAASARGEAPAPPPPQQPRPGYRFTLELEDEVRFKLADRKRDEAIQQLQEMLPRFDDDSPEKPDLLFQLSEFYWEKHRYLWAQEEKKHEQAQRAHDARRRQGAKEPEPKADHKASEQLRQEAMRLYEQILARYPKYERNDEVLFSVAFNLHQLDQQAKAVQRYHELIKKHPKSRFVPDAWVQLGDHAFDHNDLAGARSAFQKALESKDGKLASYALYKLAWCDFNAQEYEAALNKLHQVVDDAQKRGGAQVALRNEALSDSVLLYTVLDRPEDAERYYAAKAPAARRTRLLVRLADSLAQAGHEESALRLYARLLGEDPMRAEAPLLQRSTVAALAKVGRRAQLRVEAKKLSELYRPGGPWWQKHAGDRAALRDAFDASEQAMRDLVADVHKEAQETKQVETYRLARDLYRQYLDAFASSQDPEWVADTAFNQAFFHAEILWALEEWEPAYEAYDRVVRFQVPDRPAAREASGEQYRKIAAFDAILAADKLVKIERGTLEKSALRDGQKVDEKKGKGGVEAESQKLAKKAAGQAAVEEKPLTRAEERLVKACDTYVLLFPADQAPPPQKARAVKEEIDIRYQAAALLYDKEHAAEAAKRFGEIIARWPEDPRSQIAADLSMSALESRAQWAELAKLAADLAANKKLVKPGTPFGRRVENVLAGARYKWIDEVVIKREKDQRKAADELTRYVQDLPRSRYADRALTYAMLIERDLGEAERAVAAGERALREYPGSPLEPKVRYTLCRLYEQMADLPKAAQMAESFVAAHDRRRAAVEQLRKKAQAKGPAAAQAPAADADPEAEQDAPKDALAERIATESELLKESEAWLPDAQVSAALWYEGLGQPEQAAAAYQRYVARFKDRPDAPGMLYAIGMVREREQRWSDAIRAFEKFEAAYGRDPRVKPQQLLLARYRELLAFRAMKNAKKEEALAGEVARAYQRLGPEARQDEAATAAYAHARFLQVEPLWRELSGIRFNRIATVQADLQRKQKKLRELEKAYLDVLNLGVGEWGIAALSRVGLAYADLARDITESAMPRGLSEGELQLYRDELQKLALPLEDRSLEALEKALERAYQLSIYSEWTHAAQERVNALRPGSYPKAREVRAAAAEAFTAAELDKGAAAAVAPTGGEVGQVGGAP